MDLRVLRLLWNVVLLAFWMAGYILFVAHYWPRSDWEMPVSCDSPCSINMPSWVKDLSPSPAKYIHFDFGITRKRFNARTGKTILDVKSYIWAENSRGLDWKQAVSVYSFWTSNIFSNGNSIPLSLDSSSKKCLEQSTDLCVVASISSAFLAKVNGTGEMCYVVRDSNMGFKFECCAVRNYWSPREQCGLPSENNVYIVQIILVFVMTVAFLCFPAIFQAIPAKIPAGRLTSESHLNPFNCLAIQAIQLLYPTGCYCQDILRKMILVFGIFPFLFYLQIHVLDNFESEVQLKFNEATAQAWRDKNAVQIPSGDLATNVAYLLGLGFAFAIVFSQEKSEKQETKNNEREVIDTMLMKRQRERVDWRTPSQIGSDVHAFFCRTNPWLSFFLRPVFCNLFLPVWFIGYAVYIFPVARMLDVRILVLFRSVEYLLLKVQNAFPRRLFGNVARSSCASVLHFLVYFCFLIPCALGQLLLIIIIKESLLFVARVTSVTIISLALNLSQSAPYIAAIAVFLYYLWSCNNSVTSEYHKMLRMTIKACKNAQENRPALQKGGLYLTEKQIPSIPSAIFYEVCEKIMPRCSAYTSMVVRLVTIGAFLWIAFVSITLVPNHGGASQIMTLLLTVITTTLPRFASILTSGGAEKELREMNREDTIESIVGNYAQFLQENPEDCPRPDMYPVAPHNQECDVCREGWCMWEHNPAWTPFHGGSPELRCLVEGSATHDEPNENTPLLSSGHHDVAL